MPRSIALSRWILFAAFSTSPTGATVSAEEVERHTDRSGQFTYVLPEGWQVADRPLFGHDVLLSTGEDGRDRNIVVNDQPGTSPLEMLKAKYERDLARYLRDFELISSEVVDLRGVGRAVRIVHTNTTPGVPVRQVNYIVAVGDRRYFVTGTTGKDDGAAYDGVFKTFINSMEPVEG